MHFVAVLLILLFSLIGCGGGSSPAPPAEIPSVLAFPASLATDYSEVKEGGGGSVSPVIPMINGAAGRKGSVTGVGRKVAAGGEYSDEVAAGGVLMDALNSFNDIVIAVWDGVEVPTDPDTTTYTRPADSQYYTKKISFGDFDLDGDGATEGCSGSTCPVDCSIATCPSDGAGGLTCPTSAPTVALLPVCVRVWVDLTDTGTYERIIALRLDRIPTPSRDSSGNIRRDSEGRIIFDNVGNGAYRASVDSESDFCMTSYPSYPYLYGWLGSVYNHYSATDSNAASTEVFIIEGCRSEPAGGGTAAVTFDEHGISSQAASSWSSSEVEKGLNFAYCAGQVTSGTLDCDSWSVYVSNFMADDAIATNNYWRGYVDEYPGDILDNQCVDLDTGNAPVESSASTLYCSRLDVSTEAIPWINNEEFATTSDVAFPDTTQFPAQPWF